VPGGTVLVKDLRTISGRQAGAELPPRELRFLPLLVLCSRNPLIYKATLRASDTGLFFRLRR